MCEIYAKQEVLKFYGLVDRVINTASEVWYVFGVIERAPRARLFRAQVLCDVNFKSQCRRERCKEQPASQSCVRLCEHVLCRIVCMSMPDFFVSERYRTAVFV